MDLYNTRNITGYIYKHQPVNIDKLSEDLSIDREKVLNYLNNLENENFISKENIRGNIVNIRLDSRYLKELIQRDYLLIETILEYEEIKRYKLQNEINDLNKRIDTLQTEYKSLNKIKNDFIYTKEEIKKDIENVQKSNKKITADVKSEVKNSSIKNIEIMGVFISIFSIIGININSLAMYKDIKFLEDKITLLISINGSLIIGVIVLILCIKFFLVDRE